jgi:hypothetical protein
LQVTTNCQLSLQQSSTSAFSLFLSLSLSLCYGFVTLSKPLTFLFCQFCWSHHSRSVSLASLQLGHILSALLTTRRPCLAQYLVNKRDFFRVVRTVEPSELCHSLLRWFVTHFCSVSPFYSLSARTPNTSARAPSLSLSVLLPARLSLATQLISAQLFAFARRLLHMH